MFAELCFFRQAMQRQMDAMDQRLRMLSTREQALTQGSQTAATGSSADNMLQQTKQVFTDLFTQFQLDLVAALETRGSTPKKATLPSLTDAPKPTNEASVPTPVFDKLQQLVAMHREKLLDANEFARLKTELLTSLPLRAL